MTRFGTRPLARHTAPPSPGMPDEDALARLMDADPAAYKPVSAEPRGRPAPGAALLARCNLIARLLTDEPQTPCQLARKLKAAGHKEPGKESMRKALRHLANEGRAVRHGAANQSWWVRP